MSRRWARAVSFALLASLTGCAAGNAETEISASYRSGGGSQISVSYFYDNLADDGEWFQDASHGWCWTPYDMSADWRPYYDGRWEYTDYGWSWASNERFGWATYHYGRWLFDDSYGWIWVPGTEWAPAWVAWRYSDDWVGWAPLPPSAGWDLSLGLQFSNANSIPSQDWCFVPQARLLDVNVRVQVVSVARNVTLIQRSQDATRYELRDGRPANLGVDVALVEKNVRRPVNRTKVVDVDTPARGNGRSVGGNAVGYYRPKMQPATPGQAPAPAIVERRNRVSNEVVLRQHETKKRRLETELKTEESRLQRDQQREMRSQAAGAKTDEVRTRHAAEKQAFTAHAEKQRQVLEKRSQNRVVKQEKGKRPAKQNDQAKEQGSGSNGSNGGSGGNK